MKKVLYFVFVLLFTAICLVPFVGMFFGGGDGSNAEKRALAEKPQLFEENTINIDYGADFDDYFSDNFALRQTLVEADAVIKTEIFNSSPEEKVITGKDGWLFYTETLGDFSGTANMTDNEASRLATIIRLESEYCQKYGKGFVFTVAPNKASIYPEKMADYYVKSDENTNIDTITGLLKEMNVGTADMKSALLTAKNEGNQLYYKYDSHWNLLGAKVGLQSILDEINSQIQSDFQVDYEINDLKEAEREGDLLKMVKPLDCVKAESYAGSSIVAKFSYVSMYRSVDDLVIKTENENIADNTELLMFRDSFGRALIEPLGNIFAKTTLVRGVPFNIYENINENTVVVQEIVERNIKTLLEKAPIVPICEIGIETEKKYFEIYSDSVPYKCENFEETERDVGNRLTLITLEIAENNYTRVFIKATDGKYYEAFPINGGCAFYVENADAETLFKEGCFEVLLAE